MARFTTRSFVVLALVTVGIGCERKVADATAEDSAKAKKSCAKYDDYEANEGPATLARLDVHCATSPGRCAWRKKIAAICSFYGPKTSQRYDVITTLSPSDQSSQESLCDELRDGVVALSTRVDVFCKGGKTCMKCGVRAGGR